MRVLCMVAAVAGLIAGCREDRFDVMGERAAPTMVELFLDSSVVTDVPLFAEPLVKYYYQENGYRMAWTKGNSFRKAADSMMHLIRSAAYYGLVSKEYHEQEINELLKHPIDEVTRSRIDIFLTDAFFTMRYHLKSGRLNRSNFLRMRDLTTIDSLAVTDLNKSIVDNAVRRVLEKHEPDDWPYTKMKAALREIVDLQQRTFAGSIKLSSSRQSLNEQKMLTAFANLERWRWQKEKLPERYVMVNIPSYSLYVVEDDEVVFKSKVIVGDIEHESPVLTSAITRFIIYPYWHVPKSIASEEVLPAIKADNDYLDRNNFELIDYEGNVVDPSNIKWRKVDPNDFPYILRQREGPENSLGIIKFVFENPYGVYLHDTNSKRLFNSTYRALSHGCIRVEEAGALARYLYCFGNDCDEQKLNRYFRERKKKEIALKESIPVYLRYFTIDPFEDPVLFYPDVYGRDHKIIRSLSLDDSIL